MKKRHLKKQKNIYRYHWKYPLLTRSDPMINSYFPHKYKKCPVCGSDFAQTGTVMLEIGVDAIINGEVAYDYPGLTYQMYANITFHGAKLDTFEIPVRPKDTAYFGLDLIDFAQNNCMSFSFCSTACMIKAFKMMVSDFRQKFKNERNDDI